MFKKVFWLLALMFIVSISCGFTYNNKINQYQSIIKKDKMLVGISFDSKPFGFKDSKGNVVGMEADLAREISKRILGSENKVAFKNVTSQDRIKSAMSGDVDMVISTMTINPQRKKSVDFSIPYFVAGQAVCVRADSKIESIDDLINKSVIVIFGTTGEKNIKRLVPNAQIQGYTHNSEAINAFKSGLADAITTDDSLLQGLAMENKDYLILPKRLTKEPYGIAFRKSSQTSSFRHKINKIVNEMKLDGTLGAIKSKWEIN